MHDVRKLCDGSGCGALRASDVATMPPHSYSTPNAAPAANLSQWSGAWTHKGQRTTFVMVGADPRQSNATTTIPTFIIPIKFV